MTIQRVSTYSVHQNTLNDVMRTQSNLVDLQGQISSGSKTSRFDGLGTQVEHFVSLESKIGKASNYIEDNNVIQSRVNTQRTIMDGIIQTVDDIQNLIVLRRSANTDDTLQFSLQLNSMRRRISEMLNTSFEGRYLFGGTDTSSPPVPDDPTTLAAGIPDSSYYQGSTEDVVARLDDNIEMNYATRADNECFQKIFAAIYQALSASATSTDSNLEGAHDLINQGLDDLIAEKTRLDANSVSIDTITIRHQDLQLYWQGVRDNLINTDIVAASTEVAIDQAVLQASFQSFASVNRLRLVDFL